MLHDAETLAAFKQQLGIHHTEDAEFGWIAEVGLQSPLPPRWTSHTDTGSGYIYYVDHDHQASSWENPLVPFLRRVVEIGRSYMENPTESFFEDQKGLLWHQHKHELDCWHGPFADASGRQYFVNSSEGVSSWQDPRVDAQYLFELESGLLTSLEEVLPPPPRDSPRFGGSYYDEPWRTAEGAEVLTVGAAKQRAQRNDMARTNLAFQAAKEEHKSTLDRMCAAAGRVRDMQQDEEEAQRLNFKRKAEARRRERLAAARTLQVMRPVPTQLSGAVVGQADPFGPPSTLPPSPRLAGFLDKPPESPLGQSITSLRGGLLKKDNTKEWEALGGIELKKAPGDVQGQVSPDTSAESLS